MPKPMVIVDYQHQWPREFEKERTKILGVIGDKIIEVEHIGSTAVPGLGAKPIIDIMVAVSAISHGYECVGPLRSIGYEHISFPEFPERLFFRDGPMGDGPHHLHMTEFTSTFWAEKLLFRDFLRAHGEVAHEYLTLKKDLADKYGADREKYEQYTVAKTSFIEGALNRARGEKNSE